MGGQAIEITKDSYKVLWKNEVIAAHHSDPIIIDGFLYGYTGFSGRNKNDFKCVELKTGKEMWSTKEIGWGTTTFVDDHLICQDIKGNIFLIDPKGNVNYCCAAGDGKDENNRQNNNRKHGKIKEKMHHLYICDFHIRGFLENQSKLSSRHLDHNVNGKKSQQGILPGARDRIFHASWPYLPGKRKRNDNRNNHKRKNILHTWRFE